MARLDGGLFSRPRGTTAGIVFGAARTRTGKVATARQLVPPSNPNTPAQQEQRSKFKVAQDIIRSWGPSVYQKDWNRAVSQLPGFQSMQSIMTKAIGSDGKIVAPPPTRLGTMAALPELEVTTDGPTILIVSWNESPNPNFPPGTKVRALLTPTDTTGSNENGGKGQEGEQIFEDEVITFEGLSPNTNYTIAVYAVGGGTQEGNYNTAVWLQKDTDPE